MSSGRFSSGCSGTAGRRYAYGDVFDRLLALAEGIADQAHAAQFADDVDPVDIGFEIAFDLGYIDAALGRAKDQGYCIYRAGGLAHAVADAA